MIRRWTYRLVLDPGLPETRGRSVAAALVERSPNDPRYRFLTRKAAERHVRAVLADLTTKEFGFPADDLVWVHLDAEVHRVNRRPT